MKILSGILGLALMALALSFAVANRQDVTLSLWPFDISITAPLCLFTLGTLLFGVLAGALAAWLAMLPRHFERRRLEKDLKTLHEKLQDMQQTVLPPRGHLFGPRHSAWAFWKR